MSQPRVSTDPVPEYLLEDFRRTYLRIAGNEHWYQQEWLGVPIWQLPDDLIRLQKIVWDLKPELIIETGTKYGGMTLYLGSLLDMARAPDTARIVTVDIEILDGVRETIANHPCGGRVAEVIEGDAASETTLEAMRAHRARADGPCLIALDDFHDGAHVLKELQLYSELTRSGDILIVFDTVFADFADTPLGDPSDKYPDMANSNPRLALEKWLSSTSDFEVITEYSHYGVSNFFGGILRRR